jgi:hypothetical protein
MFLRVFQKPLFFRIGADGAVMDWGGTKIQNKLKNVEWISNVYHVSLTLK